jgi:hypothetical protein
MIQACAGHEQETIKYCGMYSYLPGVINKSEKEILNSCCKILDTLYSVRAVIFCDKMLLLRDVIWQALNH